MRNLIAITSRVRLARNYADFPFDLSSRPEDAEALVARTVSAVSDKRFTFSALSEMQENQRQMLLESQAISKDLLKHPETGALLLNAEDRVSIMMNEDDHVRVQAVSDADDLQSAADRVFHVDDTLSRQVNFAFDRELGYLTACPADTGTGMRASMRVHLPMVNYFKQTGAVGQTVARFGLNIRGVYGEGSEALGCIYEISNHGSLGRTETEIIRNVMTVGSQLAEMEEALRTRLMTEDPSGAADSVYRAYGILRGARLMERKEFLGLWSTLRLGMLLGMIQQDLHRMSALLVETGDAHLRALYEGAEESKDLRVARAARIREAMRKLDAPMM